jgi:hypothetical protein
MLAALKGAHSQARQVCRQIIAIKGCEYNEGLDDLFIQPLMLGWRDKKYVLSLGLGLYVPVGEYDEDANDNIGLDFWTGKIQAAGYYYLNKQQASPIMLSATYEIQSEARPV